MGTEIRRARQDAGLTLKEFARRLGVNPSTVVRWEAGTTEPRVGKLREIASVCERSVDAMLGEARGVDAH